jgi:hypothetical protein
LLIITGCSLLTKPFWIDLLNSIFDATNSTNDKIKFSVIGEWDWALGLAIVVIALRWNTFNRIIDLKEPKEPSAEYKKLEKTNFDSFSKMCQALYSLLKDNEYIFKTVGPNSGADIEEELRMDMTMWHKYRSETILPNNQKIKQILEDNQNIIPSSSKKIMNDMILHIGAFEEHVKNPSFDYSQYIFPKEFPKLIETECLGATVESESFLKKKTWLKKKIEKLQIEQTYLMGSGLFISDKANDLDVVILLKGSASKEILEVLSQLKQSFQSKFKMTLHLTTFTQREKLDYAKFIDSNEYKISVYG